MSRQYNHIMNDGSRIIYSKKFQIATWIDSDGKVLGMFSIPMGTYGTMQVFLPFILMDAEEEDFYGDIAMFLSVDDDELIREFYEDVQNALADSEDEFFDMMVDMGYINDYELYY